MSDREIVEGMKAFAEWHKDYMKKSIEVNTWKILVDCIPKKEPIVELTVKEAKEFEAMIYDFLETFESQFKDVSEWNDYVKLYQSLLKRIEQVEREHEAK